MLHSRLVECCESFAKAAVQLCGYLSEKRRSNRGNDIGYISSCDISKFIEDGPFKPGKTPDEPQVDLMRSITATTEDSEARWRTITNVPLSTWPTLSVERTRHLAAASSKGFSSGTLSANTPIGKLLLQNSVNRKYLTE